MAGVPCFYVDKWGMSPGVGTGVDFTKQMRAVIRELRKLYPIELLRRIQLMADDMCAIRSVMNLTNVREQTYWELLASQ